MNETRFEREKRTVSCPNCGSQRLNWGAVQDVRWDLRARSGAGVFFTEYVCESCGYRGVGLKRQRWDRE
jgi:DNA-directed RNA polymerase subunit RPC12/RpoP